MEKLLLAALLLATSFTAAADPAVSAGENHVLALDRNGTVLVWGAHASGQLGLGAVAALCAQSDGSKGACVRIATPLTGFGKAIAVAAGKAHSLLLKEDNSLWSFGANEFLQLGTATLASSTTPMLISAGPFQAIAAGGSHSLATKTDGTVWAWGNNADGQLGVADYSVASQCGNALCFGNPQPLTLSNVVSVAAGERHSLALSRLGQVFAWGANSAGQTTGARLTQNTPLVVDALNNVMAIAAGADHSLALDKSGVVFAWGGNGNGQLGDGTTANRNTPQAIVHSSFFVAIAAGNSFSAALDSNGVLWTWGRNSEGQLGLGSTQDMLVPTKSKLPTALALAAGNGYMVGMIQDSTLCSWGANPFGQLGDGTVSSRTSPKPVPGTQNMALREAEQIFAWAENIYPNNLSPRNGLSSWQSGYYYRFYADIPAYLGVKSGRVFYAGPLSNQSLVELGWLADFLAKAR